MKNYFTVDEAEMFIFYRIPYALFTNPQYKKISAEAKILYGLLLDRNCLSIKNNWVDDKGHVYIYFSREEAMELLNVSDKPTTKAFKELENVELIEEKRQGLGKANIIYVKKFINVATKESYLNRKNSDSGIVKTSSQDTDNLRGSNTYINNTDLSNKLVSKSMAYGEETDGLTDLFQKAKIELFENEPLKETLKETITELHQDNRTKETVKKIDIFHIDQAIAKFREAQEEKQIKNPKLYFKRCLLSAIEEGGLRNIV